MKRSTIKGVIYWQRR